MTKYDNPFDDNLSGKFSEHGKVVFLLPKYKAKLLKSTTKTDMRLWELRVRNNKFAYKTYGRLLMLLLAVKSIFLSICCQDAIKIFDFYLMNKYEIENIHQKLIKGHAVEVIYKKKGKRGQTEPPPV